MEKLNLESKDLVKFFYLKKTEVDDVEFIFKNNINFFKNNYLSIIKKCFISCDDLESVEIYFKNVDSEIFKELKDKYGDVSRIFSFFKSLFNVQNDPWELLSLYSKEDNHHLKKLILLKMRTATKKSCFWIKIFKRDVDEQMNNFARGMIFQILEIRKFEKIYEVYLESCQWETLSEILVEILSKKAESEKELDIVLYLARDNSRAAKKAIQKKTKLAF